MSELQDVHRLAALAGNPDTAFRLHALLGGTPAYKLMSGGQPPRPGEPFDRWVAQHLLSQSSAMFREGNVLLAEDDQISDAAPYLAVLAAISGGATRRSQIAAAIGRPATAIAHLLTALVEARLIRVVDDALRQKRAAYVIEEPVLRLHELLIAPNDARLARHQGPRVWQQAEATVSSKIYGPQFEDLGRTWCAEHASGTTLGGAPDKVGPTEVSCKEHGSNHEIDVVVQTRTKTGLAASALGEAKWRANAVDTDVLRRLDQSRCHGTRVHNRGGPSYRPRAAPRQARTLLGLHGGARHVRPGYSVAAPTGGARLRRDNPARPCQRRTVAADHGEPNLPPRGRGRPQSLLRTNHVELENALNPHAGAVARVLLRGHTQPDRRVRTDAVRPMPALA